MKWLKWSRIITAVFIFSVCCIYIYFVHGKIGEVKNSFASGVIDSFAGDYSGHIILNDTAFDVNESVQFTKIALDTSLLMQFIHTGRANFHYEPGQLPSIKRIARKTAAYFQFYRTFKGLYFDQFKQNKWQLTDSSGAFYALAKKRHISFKVHFFQKERIIAVPLLAADYEYHLSRFDRPDGTQKDARIINYFFFNYLSKTFKITSTKLWINSIVKFWNDRVM